MFSNSNKSKVYNKIATQKNKDDNLLTKIYTKKTIVQTNTLSKSNYQRNKNYNFIWNHSSRVRQQNIKCHLCIGWICGS